jgi:Cap4 dsDNA endonuclease
LSKLAAQLTGTPQRENAGADSASRYHYQALFGLALILKTHNNSDDYAVVFEFHDDIALLDSSHNPQKVSFFQVKTKQPGAWTLAALLKQNAGAKTKGQPSKLSSIIGKMYQNVLSFGEYIDATTFVSNAHMNFGPNSSEFSLDLCDSDQIEKAKAQIQSEHPSEELVKSNLIHFFRSELSLDDSDTHAKGMLSKFVAANLGDVEFSLETVYRAVVDECTRKSRIKCAQNNFPEVVEKKAITKAKVESWLDSIRRTVEIPGWEIIVQAITYPHLEKLRLGKEWQTYRVQVLDPNSAVSAVRGEIARELEDSIYSNLSLMEMIDKVLPKVEAFAKERLGVISSERIKVMIIYETYAKD